ncbi:nitroreductase family protein [Phenylobacterium immobile]|uniref:nitroreductase family protein n=1 Tax=Phenylobacterium immobile TaxID=21 RepID=UPI000A784EE6|nr:nitroreductase [Phenylobacterium immobile]
MVSESPAFGEPVALQPQPQVLDFLARRRSHSALTLTAPGPSASELSELLRLAAHAPDHGKLSPWRFVIFEGESKARFAQALENIARGRGDERLVAKLAKLRTPPLTVAVVSSPKPGAIPEWEQRLSAAAVCQNLLIAVLAMGYGGNWITDWYAYDGEAAAVIGLAPGEQVAGFLMIGTSSESPRERERPDMAAITTRWDG